MNPDPLPPETLPRLSRRPLSGILVLLLLLVGFAPLLRAEQFGDFTYEVVGASVTITKYTGTGWDVTIPTFIDGRPVTVIGNSAFEGLQGLISVTIPNSVTSIGNFAFLNCSSLAAITIPNSATSIGTSAFENCYRLADVAISNRVTFIGNSAFQNCATLEALVIPNSVTFIGNSAFQNCLTLRAVIMPNSIASISSSTFEGCEGLSSITIPHTVTSIGNSAFLNCWSLEALTIPNSVTSIGDSAFKFCRELTTTLPDRVASIGASAFSGCSNLSSIAVPYGITSIADSTFADCSGLISVTLPESVSSIGDFTFAGCSRLTSVAIPIIVTAINRGVFANCAALTTISIPDKVTSIGVFAFAGCSSLTSVTIPSSVTYIEERAFHTCPRLTSLSIPNSVTHIGKSAFEGSGLTSITIPAGVTSIEDNTFSSCPALSSVLIADSATSIGVSAFANCAALTAITIPRSVASIGVAAFSGCAALTAITIPDKLTTIADSTFSGCTVLRSVIIPGSVTSIGESAFRFCAGLTFLSLPNSITHIGATAFEMSGLTEITIPSRVSSMGDGAFSGCPSLVNVIIANGVPTVGKSAFSSCAALQRVVLPDSLTALGEWAFAGSGLKEITIPNSVTSIGSYCFFDCLALDHISLPASLTTIGAYTFQGSGLVAISLPDNLTTIEDSAFQGCGKLKTIDIPDAVTSIGASAFSGSGLESVVLPRGLKQLSPYTFAECRLLASVTLPEGLVSIGMGAFRRCSSLASIIIPDGVALLHDEVFYLSGVRTITLPPGLSFLGGSALASSELTSVFFRGNAPAITVNPFGTKPAAELSVFSPPGGTGFMYPVWQHARSIRLDSTGAPFAVLRDNLAQSDGGIQQFNAFPSRTASSVFSVLNTSGVPVDFTATLTGSPTFSLTSPLPAVTVAPWALASFTITFIAPAEGSVSAEVIITSSSSAEDQPRRVPLVGVSLKTLPVAQSAYVKASNTGGGDLFGESLAISGDTAVVAAPVEDSSASGSGESVSDAGAVYVFVKSETGWTQQALLKASNADARDRFGGSVAIDGDTIVVGAPKENSRAKGINGDQRDNDAIDAGAAYVFTRTAGVWTQQAYLKASNTNAGDEFGSSVAISGDLIAVGAPLEDSDRRGVNGQFSSALPAGDSGAAYLFTRTGSSWSQSAWLKASNTGAGDLFGCAVAVSGRLAVVGAKDEDDARPNSGAVYVFETNGGVWTQQAFLKPVMENLRGFGRSLAISGDTILAGAPAQSSGAAFLYQRTESGWSEQINLVASPPVYSGGISSPGNYGWSVGLSGDIAVIGAPIEGNPPLGQAYIFQRVGGVWNNNTSLAASNYAGQDTFAASAAISGSTVLLGAPTEDSAASGIDGNQLSNGAPDSGAAYIFEISLSHSAPVFTSQPQSDGIVLRGAAATLRAEASGIPAPSFRWYRGNTGDTSSPISNGNWKVLTTAPVTTPAIYWVRATNAAGQADSLPVTIAPVEPTAEQWRALYFGAPDNTGPAADSADPDGDGASNLQEYTAGTLPKDPVDLFRINAAGRQEGGFRLTVPGKAGRSYQLVRTADPAAESWDPVMSEGPVSAAGPLDLIDPAPPAGRAFYRVIVSYP